MEFLKKISSLFTGPARDSSIWVSVQCDRCGEIIRARIDLINDLSDEYGEGERETTYFCRKVLVGKQGCYLPIEVVLKFDSHRHLLERQITGGKFVEG